MSVHDAMVYARRRLETSGVSEAPLEAEVLLRHVLNLVDRASYFSLTDLSLTPQQQENLEGLLIRREQREPIPYILQRREFYGITLEVSPAVLIPRPETEGLVDEALRWIENRSRFGKLVTVVDVGVGSGCIAIALAHHSVAETIYGTDVSFAAIEIATRNLHRYGLEERVKIIHGELLSPLPKPVDLIVANLPYVIEEELGNLAPEIRDYEPRIALIGGQDGTSVLSQLLDDAPRWLNTDGALIVEIDPRQKDFLISKARLVFPLASVRIAQDLAGLDRVMVIEQT
jgi:release factor glutamine methyltransferase